MTSLLQRYLNVKREEVASLLVSTLFFFCILTCLMMLRPARDALGVKKDMDDIRWLFIGTAVVTLAVNPAFSWLVSRFQRITFISATYGFFALSLIGFYALLEMTPAAVGDASGKVFYVWFSVFNLFCTMVFWALMADRYTLEQSKRLFGTIAVGGTLGAIAGPALSTLLVDKIGTPALLIVAAGFLVVAVGCAWGVAALQAEVAERDEFGVPVPRNDQGVIGGNAWSGITAVLKSQYLVGISAYMLILAVISTLIYFTRLEMVSELWPKTDQRTKAFAQIDLITQTATLVLQVLVAGHVMKRFGVTTALIILPVIMAFGFAGLAMIGSLAAVITLDVIFKSVQRAIMRPARETLFTVVSREEKYKSKAVTDTFVYRGGDVLGAWTQGVTKGFMPAAGITAALAGLAAIAVPLSVVWAVLGFWLGAQQLKIAAENVKRADPEVPDLAAIERPPRPF